LKRFRYVARDLYGHCQEGLQLAGSPSEVLSWLRGQSLIPVEVRQIRELDRGKKQIRAGQRVKSADLAAFCWQLTTMIEGGVPAAAALDTITHDMENRRFAQIISDVSERMKKGESFSGSVSGYSKTFGPLFGALILASETGGSLTTVLQRLGKYYDERDKLVQKLKAALTYPLFAVGVISVILVIIMAYIVPSFRTLFEQFEGKLPAITLAFMSFYDVLLNYFPYIIGGICLLIFGLIYYGRTARGHLNYSRLALSLPIVGQLISRAFIAIFCRTAGTLLGSGVSVVESFDILSETTKNEVIKSAIIKARERVIEGSSVAAALAASGFFPNMLITMITVGEQSGALPRILDRTSEYYDRKVGTTIAALTAILEPALIITIGLIVLIIVLALYMPIFTRGNV